MIRITNLLDLWKCERIPDYIAKSMEEQLIRLCREWLTYDIGSFGAFYYIEDRSDLDRYREIGMTERIESAEPECLDGILSDDNEVCFQICHIISDDFAVYIFCKEKYLSRPLP